MSASTKYEEEEEDLDENYSPEVIEAMKEASEALDIYLAYKASSKKSEKVLHTLSEKHKKCIDKMWYLLRPKCGHSISESLDSSCTCECRLRKPLP